MEFDNQNQNKIIIDGNFCDWEKILIYSDDHNDVENNTNINIFEFTINRYNNKIFSYLKLQNDIFAGTNSEYLDTIRIFFDIDCDADTGYLINTIGADLMFEASGINGLVKDQRVFEYSDKGNTNWNKWFYLTSGNLFYNRGTMELEIDLPLNGYPLGDRIYAIFHVTDNLGTEDWSDYKIDDRELGALQIIQRPLVDGLIKDSESKSELLELEFCAIGKEIIIDSEVLSNQLEQEQPGIYISELIDSIKPKKSETIKVFLNANNVSNGQIVNIDLAEQELYQLNPDNIPVTIHGEPVCGYYNQSPSEIIIDGAFGDWQWIENHKDDLNESTISNNPNIDITEYRSIKLNDKLSFYLKVDGTMMKGSRILASPLKFSESLINIDNSSSELQTLSKTKQHQTSDLPDLFGHDIAYIFIDTDLDPNTGYTDDLPVGAELMVKILGLDGEILTREMYEFDSTDLITSEKTWRKIEHIEVLAETNTKQLEAQISILELTALSITGSFEDLNIYFMMTDWQENKDITDNIKMNTENLDELKWLKIWQEYQNINSTSIENNTSTRAWNIETVDDPGMTGSYPSIDIDSKDCPHISYYDPFKRDLKYIKWTGTSWSIQTLDTEGWVGWQTSLKIDSKDNPHISYNDYDPVTWVNRLNYANWTGTKWNIETVDIIGTGFGSRDSSSIAIDSNNYPYISYYNSTYDDLRYARWNGTNWTIETVDTVGDVGGYNSIQLDSNDNPHISYYNATNLDLKYANWTGSSWNIETIDSGTNVGEYTSIIVNNSGHPHISYFNSTGDDLKHAYWNGTNWKIETVDSWLNIGLYTSIELDSNENPFISYIDNSNDAIKIANWTGSTWNIVTVDNSAMFQQFSSLALNKSDHPYISYFDNSNPALKMANWTGLGWSIQFLDRAASVGLFTSIALDKNRHLHIAYYDDSYGDLKYANWNGQTWKIEKVDSSGNVGRYPSIDLDTNNYPHISYFDESNSALKYIKWTGQKWITEIIDSIGTVGMYTSIALDVNDYPHISYYNFSSADLKYTNWTGSSWNIQTVDGSGIHAVGEYSSLALDSNNNPYIGYYNWSGNCLKCANWTGSTWNFETIDGGVYDVGLYISIIIDTNDRPHISYHNASSLGSGLKYANWTGTNWYNVTIDNDSSPSIGMFTSIALDKNNYPYITYYSNLTARDLNIAYWNGSVWNKETIDSIGDIGIATSIAFDSNGTIHISYYDDTADALKYANNIPEFPLNFLYFIILFIFIMIFWTRKRFVNHEGGGHE
jgi:hypothetical protein